MARKENFSEVFFGVRGFEEASKSPAIKWLVRYDSSEDCVYVDVNAPCWYAQLAEFHELLCCGHHYDMIKDEEDRKKIESAENNKRCAAVEEYIINVAEECGKHDEYIKARKKMFDFIIEHNLNKDLDPLKNTRKFLEDYRPA